MDENEMTRLQRICNKGYGWYVAFKIGKSLGAIPGFLLWLVIATVLAIAIAIYRAGEFLWKEFMAEFTSMVSGYWDSRWFSGFSREHWASLYRKPKPVFYFE